MRAALGRSAEALAAAGLRRGEGPIDVDWLAAVREEVAARPEHRGDSMESIRLAAFREAVSRCGVEAEALAQSAHDQYMRDRIAQLHPYPDAADALAAMAGRYRLALVTNGNTHPGQVGLAEEAFAEIVIAIDCGVHKPDPRIYALTAERLAVEPGSCVHVGDHPEEDVEAAREAGMAAIWINRNQIAWPTGLEPAAAEIDDLSHLPRVLARWSSA
jgi:putative hydrolase of the HAD superfamily